MYHKLEISPLYIRRPSTKNVATKISAGSVTLETVDSGLLEKRFNTFSWYLNG